MVIFKKNKYNIYFVNHLQNLNDYAYIMMLKVKYLQYIYNTYSHITPTMH